MKPFPKQIAVTWDQQPNDEDSFLLASTTAESHADGGEWKKVGVYKLVEVVEVREVTEFKQRKSRK